MKDNVNHPKYYNSHPSGIECIDVIRYFSWDIGSAIKYLWRQGLKQEEGMDPVEKQIEDCSKAVWCVRDHKKELYKKLDNPIERQIEDLNNEIMSLQNERKELERKIREKGASAKGVYVGTSPVQDFGDCDD